MTVTALCFVVGVIVGMSARRGIARLSPKLGRVAVSWLRRNKAHLQKRPEVVIRELCELAGVPEMAKGFASPRRASRVCDPLSRPMRT